MTSPAPAPSLPETVAALPRSERKFLARMGMVVVVSLLLYLAFFMNQGGESFSGGASLVADEEGVAGSAAARAEAEAAEAAGDDAAAAAAAGRAAEAVAEAADAAALAALPGNAPRGGAVATAGKRLPGQGVPNAEGKYRVIAFSLFARSGTVPGEMFTAGVIHNLRLKQHTFPEWQFRIYLADNVSPAYAALFEDLGVEVVRMPFQKERWMDGMFWRFTVADDPNVERFLVRDLDGRLSLRESLAVKEWIRDGTAFHSIRDNRAHSIPVMGGMWGGVGRLARFANDAKRRKSTFAQWSDEYKGPKSGKGEDQTFMAQVWPFFKHNVTNHDTFKTQYCVKDRPEWCHKLDKNTADYSYCTDVGKKCYYFVGAAFGPDRAIEDTYDCAHAIEDGTVCPYLKMDYKEQYREMSGGKSLPFEFTRP